MSGLIPAHAELVDLMTVCKTKMQPSRFVTGVMALISIFECPECHREYSDPGVFNTINCECGLSMQCTGASASIWRDVAPATAE